MDILKKYILPIGIIACGTAVASSAYDQVLTIRHLTWCVMTLILVLSTKEIKVGKLGYLALGYLGFALLSGIFAINKAEWIYSVLRIFLMVSYLMVVKIDRKLLAQAMLVLGGIFIIYFWWTYFQGQDYTKGLMRQKNFWGAANFFILPFCYYALDKGFWRKYSMFLIPALLVNIALIGSRSAILAVIVSTGLVMLLNKKLRLCVIAAGAVSVLVLLLGGMRLLSSATLQDRLVQWKPAVKMAVANPVGVGAGNWFISFPEYSHGIKFPNASMVVFKHPHNSFLWVWGETGIGGIICYVGMFGLAMFYAWRKKEVWLLILGSGLITIACFSASRERAFASLITMTFFILVCEGRKVSFRYLKPFVTVVLLFTLVVFGYRHRANRWNKTMRSANGDKQSDWHKIASTARGYSVFSTVDIDGHPWKWWQGMANLKLGNRELGGKQLGEAYKYNPYSVNVLNGMGISSEIRGEPKMAKWYYKKALQIRPLYKHAQINLARINQ